MSNYLEEDEETKRIEDAYANHPNLIDWEEEEYDEEELQKAYEEYQKTDKYMQDNNLCFCIGGENFGFQFDMAEESKSASSFKSYLIHQYAAMENMLKHNWESLENGIESRECNRKLHELRIKQDEIVYKKWALRVQGFDLDEWKKKNKEWIGGIV